MAEQPIYQDEWVKVTESVVNVNDKTYATDGITSVEIKSYMEYAGDGFLRGIVTIVIVVLTIAMTATITYGHEPNRTSMMGWIPFVIGCGLLVFRASTKKMRSRDVLVLGIGGVESSVFSSVIPGHIRKIVDVIEKVMSLRKAA